MTTFATLPLHALVSSLTNPRKTFNADKLQELAISIAASGVHQPILVRPLPATRLADTFGQRTKGTPLPTHEIIAGERRYRASQLAGVATIPAMVRELTDDQVLEVQLVENLQRDDLTELEEAEGYERLMQHSKISVDDVGAKIGKSRSYVYARLKLLDLCQEAKQALREGAIDNSRALLIARIPDSQLQLKALEEASSKDYRGDVPSVRTFQSWLQNNVMLRLEDAVFKITDSRLVKDAGSCKDCPKRTGANPDLFTDVASADICIDPVCFHAKEQAHRDALIARAASKGMRFIEGKEAQELIAHQYSQRIEGYTPLTQVREDITSGGQSGLTMRELLGKDAPGAVLIENPYSHELIEAVPTDEAEAVLLAKGLLTQQPVTGKKENLAKTLEDMQYRIKHQTGKAQRNATFAATISAVRATDQTMAKALLGSTVLRAWLLTKLDGMTENDMAQALGYTFEDGEDEQDALVQHIKSSDHANLCRAAVILMCEEGLYYQADAQPPILDTLCAVLAVPVKAIHKKAAKTVMADYADELKEIQAKIAAQKPPTSTAPLAQPSTLSDAGAKPKASKQPKLSAKDAQSGIAEAMQGIEASANAAEPAPLVDAGAPFQIGQQVIVLDNDRLQLKLRKWAGKKGTVTARLGGDVWDVTFKGRNGGFAGFEASELKAVATTA